MDFDGLISRLDLTAKIRLLTGAGMWSLPPLPEIGLDAIVMSDGPIGVRGGAPQGDRFTVDVRVSERALRELYLRPFERVVAAGAWGVMTAYNGVNGTTMTEHAELVHGVLKGEWGFDGFVVSD